ncbi:MAG: hypothetical protein ACR2RV_12510 [Verrucomicrobiales bacterium]
MKSNLSVWTTALVLLAIAAATLVWQRSSLSATREEIADLKQKIGAQALPPTGVATAPEIAVPTPDRPSVGELLEMLPQGERDMGAMFRAVPIMFEQIQDYTSDELLGLMDDMDELTAGDPSKAGVLGLVKSLLMVIVADEAPERVLAMVEKDGAGTGAELRSAAFAGLARKDPDRARQLLEEADWPARQIQVAKSVLLGELLKSDLPAALELFREERSDLLTTSSAIISDASSDPAVRDRLWTAVRSESDPVVRHELAKGLIAGEFIRGGPQAMRQAFADADFDDVALKTAIVQEFAGSALPTDPDETYAWIEESLPAEEVPQALARALGSWARRDFNAAGQWLGAQPDSPARDEAIGMFARTVVEIDPLAAATWAASIAEEETRQTALGSTLGRWTEADPEAAKAWADENGIDTSELPRVPGSAKE